MVDTTGYASIQVSFATQRTSTGFNNNVFQYTLDGGVNWVTFSSYTPPTSFALQSFNLSAIVGLNNNPQAGFRIIFNGATSDSGNNRLDNLVVEGVPQQTAAIPEPSALLLLGSGLIGFGLRRRSLRRPTET
ncbi:MprA protease, GlyGly-CTERM protein-sorting domain-containing form [Pyrinomonas sp.]|uniref:MprA protease, GlyGly-CTERM protein-sorting domain-containing form n=1 Tax=Pyrinomonas sp. TaxID=2080306 RepID=UPI00332889B0